MTHKPFALVFPGQGSQAVGMMTSWLEQFLTAKKLLQHASDILGYDCIALIEQGPVEKLNQTEFTQPALLAASYAMWRIWCEQSDLRPTIMAGHSLGEYTALVCAEALTFDDALRLVQKRGQLMQQAVPEGQGAMAAIVGLEHEDCEKLCQSVAAQGYCAIANLNSIGQIVISGEVVAVQAAVEQAKSFGAKLAKLLPVSVPSHSQLMQPASEKFAEFINSITFKPPMISVIHNVDLLEHNEIEAIKKALIAQLYSPVRWVETIQKILNYYQTFSIAECGPGKVLVGLNKRIDDRIHNYNLNEPQAMSQFLQELTHV